MPAINAVPQRAKRVGFHHSVFVRPCGLPSRIFRTRPERNENSTPKIRSATKLTAKAYTLHPSMPPVENIYYIPLIVRFLDLR